MAPLLKIVSLSFFCGEISPLGDPKKNGSMKVLRTFWTNFAQICQIWRQNVAIFGHWGLSCHHNIGGFQKEIHLPLQPVAKFG